ncbi:MAG: tetratricopeptide repeat protein [Parvularculaceae bacterium]
MTNDESVIREVDQELAHERQWAMFRKHGPALISAAVAVVAFVGGWQFYNYRKTEVASRSAIEYAGALRLLEEDETSGLAALNDVIDEGSGGYPVLARLQKGALLARSGDRAGALAAFRAAAEDGRATKRLRELARLRAAYLLLEDGRDAVATELGPLVDQPTPLGYYARELAAVAALEDEDYDGAAEMFRRASIDLNAPGPVRQRAEELRALAAAARSGVNISGRVRTQDLLRALGEESEASGNAAAPDGETAPADENAAAAADGPEAPAEESGDRNQAETEQDAGAADGEDREASENG